MRFYGISYRTLSSNFIANSKFNLMKKAEWRKWHKTRERVSEKHTHTHTKKNDDNHRQDTLKRYAKHENGNTAK